MTLDASAAIRALFVHERTLAAAQQDLPPDGRAQQLVFLASYHLMEAASGITGAWQPQPSERVVVKGARVLGLGREESTVALGFVRLLTVAGWHRFALEALLDWNASVRLAFVAACAGSGSRREQRTFRLTRGP